MNRTVRGVLPPKSRAFTLVELLVVIVVISVLVGITIPVSKYVVMRAKKARQDVMVAQIRAALDDYRATYGEFPITPPTNPSPSWYNSPAYAEVKKHYWSSVVPDSLTYSNSPYTNVNLSTSTVEKLDWGYAGTNFIDYSLTFPLSIRQELEGKQPLMKFEKVTIMYLVYGPRIQEVKREVYRRVRGGGFIKQIVSSAKGLPVDRTKAIDPVTGYQWNYLCTNGIDYELSISRKLE